MARTKELSFTQLRKECDPTIFKFKTTKEVSPFNGIIGQQRGIKAFEFGVNVDVKGYNIYIEGSTGIGKTIYAKKYLNDFAKDYINFINEINSVKNSGSKDFYIIISNNREENNWEDLIIEELNEKYFKIKECLLRCGNYVRNINNKKEAEKILYSFLNTRLELL